METSGKKHLSMLRSYTIADLFTIGNATCGTLSIFLCLDYIAEASNRFLWIGFILLLAALFFDIFDGYWARRSGRQSDPWRRPGFPFGHHFLRSRTSGAGLYSGNARGMGHVDPGVFRRLWHQQAGALQRNVGSAFRRYGQGEILRGHPDPEQHFIVLLLGVAFSRQAINDDLWFGAYRVLTLATLHPLTLVYGLSGLGMISATIRIPKP